MVSLNRVLAVFYFAFLGITGDVVVLAQEPPNPTCDVCGDLEIGAPENIVVDPVTNDRIACSLLQQRGEQLSYSAIQCRLFVRPAASA